MQNARSIQHRRSELPYPCQFSPPLTDTEGLSCTSPLSLSLTLIPILVILNLPALRPHDYTDKSMLKDQRNEGMDDSKRVIVRADSWLWHLSNVFAGVCFLIGTILYAPAGSRSIGVGFVSIDPFYALFPLSLLFTGWCF